MPAATATWVAATITRPEYQGLFGALRAFAGSHGRRVVYVVGNHSLPEQVVYCEHGNQILTYARGTG
jgi:hypothetical protein